MTAVDQFVTMLQQLARGEITAEDARRIESELSPDARMSRDYETIRALYDQGQIDLAEARRRCERIGHTHTFERDHSLPLPRRAGSRMYK
jgi:anti-sigma factor RsiW